MLRGSCGRGGHHVDATLSPAAVTGAPGHGADQAPAPPPCVPVPGTGGWDGRGCPDRGPFLLPLYMPPPPRDSAANHGHVAGADRGRVTRKERGLAPAAGPGCCPVPPTGLSATTAHGPQPCAPSLGGLACRSHPVA